MLRLRGEVGRANWSTSGQNATSAPDCEGVHVTECFVAVVRASRLAFKGNCTVKFNSETVAPISNNFLSFVLISHDLNAGFFLAAVESW